MFRQFSHPEMSGLAIRLMLKMNRIRNNDEDSNSQTVKNTLFLQI